MCLKQAWWWANYKMESKLLFEFRNIFHKKIWIYASNELFQFKFKNVLSSTKKLSIEIDE